MAERGRDGGGCMGRGPGAAVDAVDTRHLDALLGYNARRAALAVVALFLERMAPFGLRPVEYSVLSVIAHNPGITSRQIGAALGILPPNLVGMVGALDRRGLLARRPHPQDGRAVGLQLTAAGRRLMRDAERTVTALEAEAAAGLSPKELKVLIGLLRRVWAEPAAAIAGPGRERSGETEADSPEPGESAVRSRPPARSAPEARRVRPRTGR